jgi:hypothetical protein
MRGYGSETDPNGIELVPPAVQLPQGRDCAGPRLRAGRERSDQELPSKKTVFFSDHLAVGYLVTSHWVTECGVYVGGVGLEIAVGVGGGTEELAGLKEWLEHEPELRGRVRLVPAAPPNGVMGGAFDHLVACSVPAGGWRWPAPCRSGFVSGVRRWTSR